MNKLLPGKAFLVCVLGLFALFSTEDAASSEAAVINKCGTTWCFSYMQTCGEVNAEAWCAVHAPGCPGPNLCTIGATYCPEGPVVAVTCGDAEI